jgi:drug/metabolite transporter (DMT)-like permease
MSILALGLLLLAAAVHAGWNLSVKLADEKWIFMWWALLVGSLAFAPLLLVGAPLPRNVWPYVLGSALAEAAYFLALANVYRLADFSLAYPIARGAAPALLALWAIVWLDEDLRSGGVLGLVLLILGLMVVASTPRRALDRIGGGARSGVLAALAVAMLISLYSVIDGAAVRLAPPATYNAAITGATALLVTLVTLLRYDRQALLGVWRRQWPKIVLVGPLIPLSYTLVLEAYTLAPVAYAGAVREVSVVLAALAGWLWLGEPLGGVRVVGAVLICAGIVAIALLG